MKSVDFGPNLLKHILRQTLWLDRLVNSGA
nr:MAG TPA: hypothetical protein [Bacteriophage sp.]